MRARLIFPQGLSTDKKLIKSYRQSLAEKSNGTIPTLAIAFAVVNVLFSFSDRYIRHMPALNYVRIAPTVLGLVACYLSLRKKGSVRFLNNLRDVWFLSILVMLYTISYMTYTTDVYKSSIPALLIGAFGAAVTVPFPTRKLAFIYFAPFTLFIGSVVLNQTNMRPLVEMGTVFTWSVVCLIMNELRDRLSFSEFKLKQQLEETIHVLKTTQTQLIQKEKMASLGELTAGIAHEIQNPLNFVNNFSELSTELVAELRDEWEKSRDGTQAERDEGLEAELLEVLTQNLQKIAHHGSRASAIVRGMLEHSRTGTGEKQLITLNTLTDEYLKIAYHGFRQSGLQDKDGTTGQFTCNLVTDFDPGLPQVEVMPQEIGRVLLNLFNNAFYAVRQKQAQAPDEYKPTVRVNTRFVPHSPEGAASIANPTGVGTYGINPNGIGGFIEIRVRDNGTGIPDNIREKIFQPFFTTKPTGEGTGLGLSLSYDIVTKGHGGTLEVESEQDGQFTEFVITLPIKS